MSILKPLIARYKSTNLIIQIIIGIILGIAVGLFAPAAAEFTSLFGKFFVSALRAIAPFLVFILVLAAICTRDFSGGGTRIKNVISLYLLSTFAASVCAVLACFAFPVHLGTLNIPDAVKIAPPESVAQVFKTLIFQMVENPIAALSGGNYIGILTWAIAAGIALKSAGAGLKKIISDINDGTIKIVTFIVSLAPFGIFGIVSESVAGPGLAKMASYLELLAVLLGAMFFIALIINPLIIAFVRRRNPYPLVWQTLKHSGIYAFFTRSSAANIPVNMALCARLNVDKELYSVSIPLGATINMGGAAVTIAVLALSCAHTLGIEVGFLQALMLSFLATFAACGASGVSGGSLLLVPLACSLFGISDEIAMQVVLIGFAIGVLQDSVETALNSSTDVLFSAACSATPIKINGKEI